MKKFFAAIASLLLTCAVPLPAFASEKLVIAAAADLKFAMQEIVADFKKSNPGTEVDVVYGSSGKFFAQIQNGAPFGMFFSADITYPTELVKSGHAVAPVTPYAIGRLVVWKEGKDGAALSLEALADPKFQKIAIANPKHAPYGQRAEEALRRVGIFEKVEKRLVLGENIAQAAQFIITGNAQAGVIALSLAMNPEMQSRGTYTLVSDKLHKPLEQGYVILKKDHDNPTATR